MIYVQRKKKYMLKLGKVGTEFKSFTFFFWVLKVMCVPSQAFFREMTLCNIDA